MLLSYAEIIFLQAYDQRITKPRLRGVSIAMLWAVPNITAEKLKGKVGRKRSTSPVFF